jgi:hypothetical protein
VRKFLIVRYFLTVFSQDILRVEVTKLAAKLATGLGDHAVKNLLALVLQKAHHLLDPQQIANCHHLHSCGQRGGHVGAQGHGKDGGDLRCRVEGQAQELCVRQHHNSGSRVALPLRLHTVDFCVEMGPPFVTHVRNAVLEVLREHAREHDRRAHGLRGPQ